MQGDDILESVYKILPAFKSFGQEYVWEWYGEKLGEDVFQDMSALSSFVSEALTNHEDYNYQCFFNYIETLVTHHDEKISTASTTNFLENLINTSSSGTFDSRSFTKYLGPKSIEYCKAWDEFCGAKTPGLWD
ncbi:MAG: hypothetical protein OXT67_04605 [Zetaproteobacteria bacterium]|nr:hypothetical protein [Zetaproteobacteria bacterium]